MVVGERIQTEAARYQKASPRAEITALAVPYTYLGQSVSSEASGPRDGVGDSHGYQCQEPLCLM